MADIRYIEPSGNWKIKEIEPDTEIRRAAQIEAIIEITNEDARPIFALQIPFDQGKWHIEPELIGWSFRDPKYQETWILKTDDKLVDPFFDGITIRSDITVNRRQPPKHVPRLLMGQGETIRIVLRARIQWGPQCDVLAQAMRLRYVPFVGEVSLEKPRWFPSPFYETKRQI